MLAYSDRAAVAQSRLGIWLRDTVIRVPRRFVQSWLLGLALACVLTATTLPAYDLRFVYSDASRDYQRSEAMSAGHVMLYGVVGVEIDARHVVFVGCCLASLAMGLIVLMTGRPKPLRIRTLLGLLTCSLWLLPLFERAFGSNMYYFSGFYLAALGCMLAAVSMLVNPTSPTDEGSGKAWYVRLGPMLQLEWPRISPVGETNLSPLLANWSMSGMEKRAIWSAGAVLMLILAPPAMAWVAEQTSSQSLAGLAMLLSLFGFVGARIMGLIGIVCSLCAAGARPRRFIGWLTGGFLLVAMAWLRNGQ